MNIKSSLLEILKEYSTHIEYIQKPIGEDNQESFNNIEMKSC